VEQNGVAATVMPMDAPLVTLGDINRGNWPSEFGKRGGTVFSYVMNNYWDTNYRAGQGGHFTFHYIVTSATATNPTELSRLGWQEITPLESDTITSQDKALGTAQPASTASAASARNLNASQQSFLEINDPNLLLQTWKAAEDGQGTIMRFLDLGGAERTVTVRVPLMHLDHVAMTDSIERGSEAVTTTGTDQFQFTVHPHQIVTLRLVEVPVSR
jgi:hypothetical protein